jgi:hypothetical protein
MDSVAQCETCGLPLGKSPEAAIAQSMGGMARDIRTIRRIAVAWTALVVIATFIYVLTLAPQFR